MSMRSPDPWSYKATDDGKYHILDAGGRIIGTFVHEQDALHTVACVMVRSAEVDSRSADDGFPPGHPAYIPSIDG